MLYEAKCWVTMKQYIHRTNLAEMMNGKTRKYRIRNECTVRIYKKGPTSDSVGKLTEMV